MKKTFNEEDQKYSRISSFAGILIRLFLVSFPILAESLDQRIEISTPLTGYKQRKTLTNFVKEGLFLFQNGISPYHGGVFHHVSTV
jgi:phosphatidylinositol glycan class U